MSFASSPAQRTMPRDYEDEFTFQPKLNARSVAMEQARVDRGEVTGRDRGEYLHNKDYEIKYRQEIMRKRLVDEEMVGCTFSPAINRNGPSNRNHVSVVKNAQLWNERRDEWRHQATEQQIRKEMQECTFQPNVNAHTAQRSQYFGTDAPPPMPAEDHATGFDKFVERQKAGREKREEQAHAKDAPVPRVETWTRATTKPQPFKFEHPVRVKSLERPAKSLEVTEKQPRGTPQYRPMIESSFSQPQSASRYELDIEDLSRPPRERVENFLNKYNPESLSRTQQTTDMMATDDQTGDDYGNSEQAAEDRYYKRMENARLKQAQKREALKNLSGGHQEKQDWTTTSNGQWKGRQTLVQEFKWNKPDCQGVASLRKPVPMMSARDW